MIYVNCYKVSLCYGGPEEGGWWYDAGEPLASVPLDSSATETEIERVREDLYAKFGQPSKGLGRRSASDPEDIEVYVEYNFADYFPKEKPHYE